MKFSKIGCLTFLDRFVSTKSPPRLMLRVVLNSFFRHLKKFVWYSAKYYRHSLYFIFLREKTDVSVLDGMIAQASFAMM